jgi:hypothetical protein
MALWEEVQCVLKLIMWAATARPFDIRSTSLSSADAQSRGQSYNVLCKQPVPLPDVHK